MIMREANCEDCNAPFSEPMRAGRPRMRCEKCRNVREASKFLRKRRSYLEKSKDRRREYHREYVRKRSQAKREALGLPPTRYQAACDFKDAVVANLQAQVEILLNERAELYSKLAEFMLKRGGIAA